MNNRVMTTIDMRIRCAVITALLSAMSLPVMAGVGATNYEMGVSGLVDMTRFVTVVMTFTLGIVFTIAGIVSVISATQIYVKMANGEDGVTKNILMLVGAVIFMIAATMVLPAIFGWSYSGSYSNFGATASPMSSDGAAGMWTH